MAGKVVTAHQGVSHVSKGHGSSSGRLDGGTSTQDKHWGNDGINQQAENIWLVWFYERIINRERNKPANKKQALDVKNRSEDTGMSFWPSTCVRTQINTDVNVRMHTIFLIVLTVLWLHRPMSLFIKITHGSS